MEEDVKRPDMNNTENETTNHEATQEKSDTSHDSEVAHSAFQPEEPQYPTGFQFAMILAALNTSMFLVALDMTIVATAIPKITNRFESLHDVGWYGSAYFLTLAAFQSFWGKMYQNFALKWSFFLALLVFEVGSVVCGKI